MGFTGISAIPFLAFEQDLWKVPKKESPDEWAERVIILPEGTSSLPGPLSLNWTPYLRKPLRDVADPEVQEIILCWSTQVAKTTGGMIMNLYTASVAKRPVLHVMPNEPAAQAVNVERYQPIVMASPELRKLVNPRRKKEFTIDQLRINGIWMDFCGAKSPTDLASRAKGGLNLDEVDKYDEWSGGEADPVELATERTRTFWDRKIWKSSTPTTDRKYIWPELLSSTNERYMVPCVECGEHQELVWGSRDKGSGGIKWPSDCRDPEKIIHERLAWYECAFCGAHIDDASKYAMLNRGVWAPVGTSVSKDGEPLDPPANKRRSGYHLWAAYSPWLTFSEIAAKFLLCFRSGRVVPGKMMNFVNSWRALPWLETKLELKQESIKSCQLPYHQGVLPKGSTCIVVTVDVQSQAGKTYLYYAMRSWGNLGESWLIRFGRLDGWESLAELFRGSYEQQGGGFLKPKFALVDSGYRTDEVYQFCLQTSAWALKGSGRAQHQQKQSVMDVGGEEVALLSVNSDYYKDKLHRVIRDGDKWHIPSDMSDEYFDHMTTEQKVQEVEKKTGKVRFIWRCIPDGAPNHAFDCYDQETEVLTRRGFRLFADVSPFDEVFATANLDTDKFEYQRSTTYLDKPYSGEMIRIGGGRRQRVDLLVTPSHRMVVLDGHGAKEWTIKKAGDLTIWDKLKPSVGSWEADPSWSPPDHGWNCNVDDFAEFMGWYVSEGSQVEYVHHSQPSSVKRRVCISQMKYSSSWPALESLLARLPWRWHYSGHQVVITNKELHEQVKPLGLSGDKFVPQWIKDAPRSVITSFLRGAVAGDGWTQNGKDRYATVSKVLADDIQELYLKLGSPVSSLVRPARPYRLGRFRGTNTRDQYWVFQKSSKALSLRDGENRPKFERVDYSGRVFCVSVPNGTLIVRRGGKVVVCGNCECYQLAAAELLQLETQNSSAVEEEQEPVIVKGDVF